MKKYTGLVLALALALALSNSALALDKVTENLKDVCLSPSQQGKFWTVTAKSGVEANGSISLFSADINAEATFTKGEWDGVQQVLKAAQAGDNDSYRKCVKELAPLFVKRFSAPAPVTKPTNIKKMQVKPLPKNPINATKAAPTKPAENSQNIQTIGNVTSNQTTIVDTVEGDVNNTYNGK